MTDDGGGMDREDAQKSVLAHATSKIASIEDLESVSTLGFRGEALPSIASVSAFELTTSTGGGAATKVRVEGGAQAEVTAASRPRGTTVSVERIFYNVPARREFLKSKKVERSAVSEIVTHLAIAHPGVGFRLTDDYREQLSLVPAASLEERLAGIYGIRNVKTFRAIEHESFPYKVTGYAALPSLVYTNRYSVQTVSVNGRWVRGSSISRAIDDAYRGTLPSGRYPPVVLSIEIDQRKVDVNVHPTKQVVRFSDDAGVRRAVADAVTIAIGAAKDPGKAESASAQDPNKPGMEPNGAAPEGQQATGHTSQTAPGRGSSSGSSGSSRHRPDQHQGRLADADEQRLLRRGKKEQENAGKIEEFQKKVADASKPLRARDTSTDSGQSNGDGSPSGEPAVDISRMQDLPERGALPELSQSRVIGQFGLGYILLEDPGSLWVVDQHVAHERVLLDRLEAGEEVSVQQLLSPEVVELSDTEAAEGQELLEELAVYGFEAEPFGPRSFRITGVISTLADRDIAEAFKDALAVARGTGQGPHREQNILATVACKSAVKLGDRLSHDEMESLVEQWLSESEKPATCPHGRSICYRMDAKEIARKLDRH